MASKAKKKKKKAKKKVSGATGGAKKLRLLTYNVKMLPGPGGEQRADRIVRAILDGGYDIVCLQEVFDEDIRRRLKAGLEATYRTIVEKVDDGDLFQEDSGLFFASRRPITGDGNHFSFKEFEETGPIHTADYWADKGIFGARVDLGGNTQFVVFHTHMQSDPHALGQYADVRRSQLEQIRRFICRILRRVHDASSTMAVLVGDMNIGAETVVNGGGNTTILPREEYLSMIHGLEHPRDVFREKRPVDPGFTWDAERNPDMIGADDEDQLRLDYVLAFDYAPTGGYGGVRPLRRLDCESARLEPFAVDGGHLSDHFGVGVDFRLA